MVLHVGCQISCDLAAGVPSVLLDLTIQAVREILIKLACLPQAKEDPEFPAWTFSRATVEEKITR